MSRDVVPVVLLTGYDAKRCARRIHNEWDPTAENPDWETPASLQVRFDTGIAFEATVFDEFRAALPNSQYVDLGEVRGKANLIQATVDAMDDGVGVILGGWLPDDEAGGRVGRPDVMLRAAGGYVPGEVKGHKVVARRAKGNLTFSRLGEPGVLRTTGGYGPETTTRLDDYLQLAHYWRMLEAIGRTPPGRARGFIIGSDLLTELTDSGRLLTWVDLEAPLFTTYSRTRGTAKRTALERYDHELGFRVQVATAAAAGEQALVEPIFTDECEACPWLEHCREVAGDRASGQITSGRLTVREWAALSVAGVVTVDDLAAVDIDDQTLQRSYLPEVTHLKNPLGRLATAVRRAGMIRDGRSLERESTGQITVPRADIEIDFDIEWDPDDRVYLWGALVNRQAAAAAYHPVVSWTDLDDVGAVQLATTFVDWLRGQIESADASGRSLLVYHYAHPEPTYLKRFLGEAEVADLLDRFVDLLPLVREHFFGLNGLGIKKVAPEFGFHWRDEDPGGLQSQLWLVEARTADDQAARQAARSRILAYNEDDVRATHAIRNGLGAT